MSLASRINDALPQTQCTRCGYPSCRDYANAIAQDGEAINRCPPGGAAGIERLAALTHRAVEPLDSTCGIEGPRRVAFIDESHCIGCTLCIKACPVDCVVGAPKRMHTIIEVDCTGCELCIPVCPVDCIHLEEATPGASGWQAWSAPQAERARAQYEARLARMPRLKQQNDARLDAKADDTLRNLAAATSLSDAEAIERKRALVQAAMARAGRSRQP